MKNRTFTVKTAQQWAAMIACLRGAKFPGVPLVVEVREAKSARSTPQNALWHEMYRRVARELDGWTFNDVRAHSKAHVGIPLLLETDAEFAEVYNRVIRPLSYEQKMEILSPPIDLPVTSRFDKPTGVRYTDELTIYWGAKGVMFFDKAG